MDKPDPKQWRHRNIGRALNNCISRFENRVLDLIAEAGHGDVPCSHLHLPRNLDISGTRMADLARRAGMSKQAIGEVVEQCERIGLVERRPDPTHAGAKIVVLTEAGLEWFRDVRGAYLKAEQEMREEIGSLRVDAIAEALASYGAESDLQ